MNFAKAVIYGRCGSDIVVKKLPNGKSLCNFSVAVNHKTQAVDETSWFRVSAFEKTADICAQYLAKGKEVMVEGSIRIRKYQTKTGQGGESVEMVASTVIVPKVSGEANPANNNGKSQVEDNSSFGGDPYASQQGLMDVPF